MMTNETVIYVAAVGFALVAGWYICDLILAVT